MGEFFVSPEDLAARRRDGRVQVVDVRRREPALQSGIRIEGAAWRDPLGMRDWIGELPQDGLTIVYCVHGHEVSQSCAHLLRVHGKDVRVLEGGIEAWRGAGLPVEPLDPADFA